MNPIKAFELLFFAVFGQTTTQETIAKDSSQPAWTKACFTVVFGIYMLLSVVVLINLLIAMMSDTYQRIQVPTRLVGGWVWVPWLYLCSLKKSFAGLHFYLQL